MSGWRRLGGVLGVVLVASFAPACGYKCPQIDINPHATFLVIVEDAYTGTRICSATVSLTVPAWRWPAVSEPNATYDGQCAYEVEGFVPTKLPVHICVRVSGYIALQVQLNVPIEYSDEKCPKPYVAQDPVYVFAEIEPDLDALDAGPADAGPG